MPLDIPPPFSLRHVYFDEMPLRHAMIATPPTPFHIIIAIAADIAMPPPLLAFAFDDYVENADAV